MDSTRCSQGSGGTKHAIGLTAINDNSFYSGGSSFWAVLIASLQNLESKRPFGVQRLYEEMLNQLKERAESKGLKAPSLATDSKDLNQPLVSLVFHGDKRKTLSLPLAKSRFWDGPRPNGNRGRHSSNLSVSSSSTPGRAADGRFSEARVLVCTTFVGEASPDMEFYNRWLQSSSNLRRDVAVEGMFFGPPTMLLISMPHSMWSVVQHDQICCYLGYISSHNVLQSYLRLYESGITQGLSPSHGMGGSASHAVDHESQSPERVNSDDLKAHKRNAPALIMNGNHHEEHRSFQAINKPALKSDFDNQLTQSGHDSVEMQEAAEQLKALSHLRRGSSETSPIARQPRSDRQRKTLPDSLPGRLHVGGKGLSLKLTGARDDTSGERQRSTGLNQKPSRRSAVKAETICNHCSHGPFKDSSSLRKHVAAAHTRPFPCAFYFAGCTSTFGSKNEWKRHISSQHLCLNFYRCSECSNGMLEGKANEFNRKDLFTQHLRRMHAPHEVKIPAATGDTSVHRRWEAHVKKMQQCCLLTRRKPPQKSACPMERCHQQFEGSGAWDEWTEHVGRHLEKGDTQHFGVDEILKQWALDERIIERVSNGHYRLLPSGTNANALEDVQE